jgi:type II secretory pathway pseudopilin PulG
MTKADFKLKRVGGFTLVEIALVVVIASIMLMAGVNLLSVRLASAQLEVTQKHQEAIKQALISYLGQYQRLPCPDTSATPVGLESLSGLGPPNPACAAYFGRVPYVTLGLDRSIAIDGWENYIAYAVSSNWVYQYAAIPTVTPPLIQSSAPQTNFPALSLNVPFWPGSSVGLISAYSNNTPTLIANPCAPGQIVSPAPPNTGGVVALISYGKNGLGATNVVGQQNLPPPVNTDEAENAAPAGHTAPYAQLCPQDALAVVKRDPGALATDSYDDLVVLVSANELTGPLVASGTLSQSQDANALAQANNYLLGNIVSSRLPCPGPGWPNGPPTGTPCTGAYYTVPAQASVTFPQEISALGVNYNTTVAVVSPPCVPVCTATAPACAFIANTGTTFTCYTISTPTGLTKAVSVSDVTGLITNKAAGYN